MHRLLLYVVVLGYVALTLGQSLAKPSSALASLPSCAATCFSSSIPVSSCSPTNQTCLCGDEKFAAVLEYCVTTTCTVKEQLTTKNATAAACGIEPRDRSRMLYVPTVTLGVITAVVVVLRLGFRAFVSKVTLEADDWAVLASLLVGLPGTILICVGTIPNGVGRDVWTLSFDQITRFGLWFFISEIQYFTNLAAVKMSLLLFYLRIFPSQTMRCLLVGTIVFDVVFGVSFVIASVVQCIPLDYFWNMWDGEHQGHCININALGWANAIISIVLDFWMLALPLSQLRLLRLHWKKKVAVAFMFMVGTFVTVVSILRLQALLTFSNSSNLTYDNFDVHLWSTIEINVAIMCACMPTMRQMLVWLFPVVFGGATTLRSGYLSTNTNPNNNSDYGSSGAMPSLPKKQHLYRHRFHSHGRLRSGLRGGDGLAPHHHPHQQLQPFGNESRVDLARPGTGNTVASGRGGQEIIVQRSFEVQDEESPGSPVQMTEFVPAHKSDAK